jgi:hypothetical protein
VLPATELEVRTSQEMGLNKDGATVNYLPLHGEAWIEFDFEVAETGRHQVNALLWYSVFASVYQPLLDGEPFGPPIDFYTSGHDAVWVRFDLHELEAGKHTLRFEGRGTSPNARTMAPPAHAFGMTYLILLRLEDMEGYHQVLDERLSQAKAE